MSILCADFNKKMNYKIYSAGMITVLLVVEYCGNSIERRIGHEYI
jgi:hypothetical protein